MSLDSVRLMRETFVARVEYHPTLDSTNDRAKRLAARGVRELPLLVVADCQTAGRGRGARRWWTGEGSLAFSLLLDAQAVAAGESRSPLVALAAGVAVAEVIKRDIPEQSEGRLAKISNVPFYRVGLHWPNDVMVRVAEPADDRKLAGILVEVLPDRRHVVGIGLNTNNTAADAPAELRDNIATIRDLAERPLDNGLLLIDLLQSIERQFTTLQSDPQAVAAAADRLLLQHGQTLTLNLGKTSVQGVCRGIARDGALLLETPAGVQSFFSGTLRS